MLVSGSALHQSIYMTSANAVTSSVYDFFGGVSSYFNLRESNETLNRRNAVLQEQVEEMQARINYLNAKLAEDTITTWEVLKPYDFIVGRVIKNSVTRPQNYITINRGSLDGIAPEMGVIDQNGVVGVVNVVGPHASRVISLLNPQFRLSCRIQDSGNFGSLVWDGEDPRYAMLEELPRHTVYQKGDTVVTSGYSAVFPAGIPVGVIETDTRVPTENLFSLRIRLLADFSSLDNVQVVKNYLAEEINDLEKDEKEER